MYIMGIYILYIGSYPQSVGQNTTMTACMVGNNSSMCIETWNVTVKNCLGIAVMYLTPTTHCGGYCMGKNTETEGAMVFNATVNNISVIS